MDGSTTSYDQNSTPEFPLADFPPPYSVVVHQQVATSCFILEELRSGKFIHLMINSCTYYVSYKIYP